MNLNISPLVVSRIIIISSIALSIKIAMLTLSTQLPQTGIDSVPISEESFYFKYKVARALGMSKTLRQSSNKAQTNQPIAPLKEGEVIPKMVFSGTLKAIYSTTNNPFIVVQVKKKVQILSIGDVLQAHTLKEIFKEYAVFEKNNRRYALRFKEDKNKKNSMTLTEVEPVRNTATRGVDDAVFVKRKEINYYAKNLNQIWKNIKIQEVKRGKFLAGFRVTWVKKGSVFESLGLLKGDLITGVNNKKFKSIAQVFKLYNNMQKMDNLKLTIIRNNEEKELEYEIL